MPKVLRYDVVFEKAPEGGYTALVPSLPGCISEGDNLREAKKNIKEAILLYLEVQKEDEGRIICPKKIVFGSVEIPTASFGACVASRFLYPSPKRQPYLY